MAEEQNNTRMYRNYEKNSKQASCYSLRKIRRTNFYFYVTLSIKSVSFFTSSFMWGKIHKTHFNSSKNIVHKASS